MNTCFNCPKPLPEKPVVLHQENTDRYEFCSDECKEDFKKRCCCKRCGSDDVMDDGPGRSTCLGCGRIEEY